MIRLALAECFCISCQLLALDEPTTNLDTYNCEVRLRGAFGVSNPSLTENECTELSPVELPLSEFIQKVFSTAVEMWERHVLSMAKTVA